ncbi:MAG: hypothetical protein WA705_02580 [Candidatus Ozemobacteraceae bacterium]
MAEEVKSSVAFAVSRKLWIPFLLWAIALLFSFNGHFLEDWRRNQFLNAIKNSDQKAFETMFSKDWYPANGTFRNAKLPPRFASLLDFALAAKNYQAARFLWDNLPCLHTPGVLSSAWRIAVRYGYPDGLSFMYEIDPAIAPSSLTSLIFSSVSEPGATTDINIPPADQQQHLRCLELLVSWGAIPANSSIDTMKTTIESGLTDCAAFLIRHGASCSSPDLASGTLLHSVLQKSDLSPAGKEMLCRLLLEKGIAPATADKSGSKAIDLAQDLLRKSPSPELSRIIDLLENPPATPTTTLTPIIAPLENPVAETNPVSEANPIAATYPPAEIIPTTATYPIAETGPLAATSTAGMSLATDSLKDGTIR